MSPPGAGKTTTLEGGRARDAGRVTPEGDGLVHLAADELFKLLNQKAVAVGESVLRTLCLLAEGWMAQMHSSRSRSSSLAHLHSHALVRPHTHARTQAT